MKEYAMEYIVDFRDVDRYFDLKAEAVLQILGRVSTFHEVQGFKFKPGYMSQWNMAWILYQWKVTIIEPKLYAHKIKIRTLPVLKKDMYCYRYFLIEDMSGNIVAKAVSQWVAVDTDKRRISRIPKPVVEVITGDGILPEEAMETILKVDVQALRKKDVPFEFELTIPVLYSDIDSNWHVNNTIYARWATETIYRMDPEYLLNNYHQTISIVYKKEKKPDGSVLSKLHIDGNTSYHEIWDEQGNLLTLMEITWVEKVQNNGDYSNYDFSEIMN